MVEPLVTAVIPTYNRADTVCESIESVLRQTYQNMEVIVVDDGSTDETLHILARFGDAIHLLHQKNAGPSAARNRGVEAAKGEIIAFLDSDDLWLPTKIERQVDILKRVGKSVPCCLCNAIVRNSNGSELSFDIASIYTEYDEGIWLNVTDVLSTRCVFFTQAVAMRREVLRRIGGFDEKLSIMEDHDLALRLSLEGPWAFVREPLVVYRKGTLYSLADQADQDRVCLQENIARINLDFLSERRVLCRRIRRNLRRAFRKTRYNLRVARIGQKCFPGAQFLAKALEFWGRVQDTAFRQLPWYPKVKIKPLGQMNS